MADNKTVMIDFPSPWGIQERRCGMASEAISRADTCRSVDKRLDEVAAEGWTLVSTQIIEHTGKPWLRVLVATFKRGKPRSR